MRRIRLGTDLRLAGVWDTVHLLEPLSADVRAHGARERSRAARTRSWMPVGADLFEVAPLDDCDVAVLPFAWEDAEQSTQRREQALAFFGRAASAGVATLVFSQSDRPQPVPRDDVVVFQHALHRSSLAPQYVALPAWIDDPFPDGLPAGLARQWTARPVVTFCGYAPPLGLPETPWPRRLVEAPRDRFRRMRCAVGIDERRGFSPPVFWRADTLRRLERDPRVDTAYVFRGGATKSMPIGPQPTDGTQASPREYRTAYVDNLLAATTSSRYAVSATTPTGSTRPSAAAGSRSTWTPTECCRWSPRSTGVPSSRTSTGGPSRGSPTSCSTPTTRGVRRGSPSARRSVGVCSTSTCRCRGSSGRCTAGWST